MSDVTAYRDEQIRVFNILSSVMKDPSTLRYEYELTNLRPTLDYSIPFCKPDVVDLASKTAIRLQGPPHKTKVQRMKDEKQREVLEFNGWKVYDFWYDIMINLYSKKRTPEIDRNARNEVLRSLGLLKK